MRTDPRGLATNNVSRPRATRKATDYRHNSIVDYTIGQTATGNLYQNAFARIE
jgi:hypothetical protein